MLRIWRSLPKLKTMVQKSQVTCHLGPSPEPKDTEKKFYFCLILKVGAHPHIMEKISDKIFTELTLLTVMAFSRGFDH